MKIKNNLIPLLTSEEQTNIENEVRKITKNLIKEVKTGWGFIGDFFIKSVMRIFWKKTEVMFRVHRENLKVIVKIEFIIGQEQVVDIDLNGGLSILDKPTIELFNYLESLYENADSESIKEAFLSLMYNYSVMNYNFILENIESIIDVIKDTPLRFHGIDFRYKKYSILKEKLIEKGLYNI